MLIADKTKFNFGEDFALFSGVAAWVGMYPPVIATSINLIDYENCRAPAGMHGKHDVVWLYERELFSVGPVWHLILDEAIRLIKESGKLIVRANDSIHGTLFELKSVLARNPNLSVCLLHQEKIAGQGVVAIFDVKRLNFYAYKDRSWSIGVLSDGRRLENVIRLIKAIRLELEGEDVEFIVAGPKFECDLSLGDVRFLDLESKDELPRISEKKLLLVEASKFSNVAIFHDRYVVSPGFFQGFTAYGYDFDYITTAQQYENGDFFPGYIGFKRREMRWASPHYSTDYNYFFSGQFINGGLIIIKRHTGLQIRFNSLLLHNEAEDVELAFILRGFGIVPRINLHSMAITIGVPSTYTSTFIKVVPVFQQKPLTKRERVNLFLRVIWARLPIFVKSLVKKSFVYEKIKEILVSGR